MSVTDSQKASSSDYRAQLAQARDIANSTPNTMLHGGQTAGNVATEWMLASLAAALRKAESRADREGRELNVHYAA